jgi:F-type H+-transporting ATPase subunit c
MAEENISDVQRQLTEAMSQVQRDLAQFGRVTQQTAEQLKDAEIQAATGLRNFTKVSNTAGQALGALAGAGVGIGNVFSALINAVARNPSMAKVLFGYAILGFALTEAIALFALMMAFLILFVF